MVNGYPYGNLPHAATSEELLTWFEAALRQEFGSPTPTDLDWVLDVVTGYNTDIDTCTISKDSTNKISAGHSLELRRAQSAERRVPSAEAPKRRAQSAECRVARSTCKAKRSHRVSARKEAAQVRTARTLPARG